MSPSKVYLARGDAIMLTANRRCVVAVLNETGSVVVEVKDRRTSLLDEAQRLIEESKRA